MSKISRYQISESGPYLPLIFQWIFLDKTKDQGMITVFIRKTIDPKKESSDCVIPVQVQNFSSQKFHFLHGQMINVLAFQVKDPCFKSP